QSCHSTSLLPCLLYRSAAPRDLHSFPTRRSSDLRRVIERAQCAIHVGLQPLEGAGERLLLGEDHQGDVEPGRHRPGFDIALMVRSEEHTSELQSPYDLVCRLLLEKKKLRILTNIL